MDQVDWGPDAPASEDMLARIEAENTLPLTACHELEAAAASRMAPWSGREGSSAEPESVADELVPLELARSTKTFRGTVALCRAGYGEQAAMLNRSLFEGMAVARWVHANPADAAARVQEAKRFDGHLAALLIEEEGWRVELTEEELANARLEGEQLAEMEWKFGKYGDRMWTGHRNLPELLASIQDQWPDEGSEQLWNFYKIVNRDNNRLLHSTVAGLRRAFSQHAEGGGKVWVGPSSIHVRQALFGAHWTYGQTLTLAAIRFKFKDSTSLNEMLAQHLCGFRDLSPDDVKNVGRNDKCPCGSGKKYKDCHLGEVNARRRFAS